MQKPTAPNAPLEAASSPAAWSSNARASLTMLVGVTVPISSWRACMSSSLIPNSR